MEWVETTGRSVQEAKEAALDELGVDEAEAEFEVLAEAQTGLFGRLRSEARVRARVRPTAPRAKEDRRGRDRKRRSGPAAATSGTGGTSGGEAADRGATGDDDSATGGAAADTGTAEEAEGVEEPGNGAAGDRRRGGRSRRTREPASAAQIAGSAGSADSVEASEGAGTAGGSVQTENTAEIPGGASRPTSGEDGEGGGARTPRRRNRNRRRTSDGPEGGSDRAASGPGLDDDDDDRTGKGPQVEVDMDRQGEVAADFLTKLTAEMGLEAQVKLTRPDEDTVEVQLSGSDLGILIGPKGATLVAVQNLTRTVVFNETGGNNGHINVDVGGYRQKRTEALARFAHQVAEQVKSSGKRTALEPMSAVDRKVVHDTISGIEGVSTISEGEEPRRRVVVLPD